MKTRAYSDKSWVTLEQHRCIVCGKNYDTGSLLLDKRLRDTFEHHTLTGTGLCPEHEKLHKEGYVALVEIDPLKSHAGGRTILKPDEVWRNGVLMHMKRTVARDVFNAEVPDTQPMMFIDAEVTAKLKSMMPEEEGGKENA